MLTHSQRAMIYLIAKGLRHKDFCDLMGIKPQRGSQLLDWRNTKRERSNKKKCWRRITRDKAFVATNNGLDVYADTWDKIEKLLDQMAAPIIPDNNVA